MDNSAEAEDATPPVTAMPVSEPPVNHVATGDGAEQVNAPCEGVCADTAADQAVTDSMDAGSRADTAADTLSQGAPATGEASGKTLATCDDGDGEDGDGEDGDEEDDSDEDEDVYEVDRILDSRITSDGAVEYLIKWKGWGAKWNSWEPSEHIIDEKLVASFEARKAEKLAKGSLKSAKPVGAAVKGSPKGAKSSARAAQSPTRISMPQGDLRDSALLDEMTTDWLLKYTQGELARAAGLHPDTLSQWMNGRLHSEKSRSVLETRLRQFLDKLRLALSDPDGKYASADLPKPRSKPRMQKPNNKSNSSGGGGGRSGDGDHGGDDRGGRGRGRGRGCGGGGRSTDGGGGSRGGNGTSQRSTSGGQKRKSSDAEQVKKQSATDTTDGTAESQGSQDNNSATAPGMTDALVSQVEGIEDDKEVDQFADFENSSEGDGDHKIESLLLGRKFQGNSRWFLIKWDAFPHAENTWEIHKNLHPEVPILT